MWARIHLIPMLQAEEDRDLVRRYWADQAREKELLGGNAKVYHSDRYVEGAPRSRTSSTGVLTDCSLQICATNVFNIACKEYKRIDVTFMGLWSKGVCLSAILHKFAIPKLKCSLHECSNHMREYHSY